MLDELSSIQSDALAAIESIDSESSLEEFRIHYLGKKGRLTATAAGMRDVAKEDKREIGQKLNEVRTTITGLIDTRTAQLDAQKDAKAVAGIDPTLPARSLPQGAGHPLSQMLNRAVDTLHQLGFAIAEGPEIEDEWHCFDALNTPEDHPARNEKDTFYFDSGKLLRTHTSTVQVRTMEGAKTLPVRIIAPGSAFRRDEIDATHSISFTQLEGLYVAEEVSLADLKGTLEYFFHSIFGKDTELRFRPHFFPFTEPSFEIDIKLHTAGKSARWIEIAGCGMVDPAVFEAIHSQRKDDLFSPDQVSGFAFGLGIDRLAMIQHGIPDLRLFSENDLRFLNQFA
ncbi:MAG: phenylalanine--tRNA ligase subunit alpha [Verrucomicrobiales bacterium]|nr:phenylalanine--tRNA ligase subunit alpha [Verrucomicrobiales bacterium]